MNSLIVPLYRSEPNLNSLFDALTKLSFKINQFEVVFVVDGSPDACYEIVKNKLRSLPFECTLVNLSRNFGSFAAIKAGMSSAKGERYAVLAADLQEPPELIIKFFNALESNVADVCVGRRISRNDPGFSAYASNAFWFFYRKLVIKDMPKGGVDIFGCNKTFRDQLINLNESNSSLVGLVFWLGFRRLEVPYARQQRIEGESGWSLRKKIEYMLNSLFAFSDLPIKVLILLGIFGILVSTVLAIVLFFLRFSGLITVPGYTATILVIVFFGGLNSLGLGILGSYVWRAYENTKNRPNFVVSSIHRNGDIT